MKTRNVTGTFRFVYCHSRLRVVPHFSSGIVEQAKREKRRHAAWGDFHARSRFARSTNPEEKWGTTRSLLPQSNSRLLLV